MASDAPHLTFIIPIRHQDNARDWNVERSNLHRTARSIAGQTTPGWRAVVVANEWADLPPLPAGFEVVRVDHPPNPHHDLSLDAGPRREQAMYTFRRDKGRRVADGMRHAAGSRYFMVVDGDDLVSNRLSGHVAANLGATGWRFEKGWCMDVRERYVFSPADRFDKMCGTSHIVRADLYALPSPDHPGYWDRVANLLGSHMEISDTFEREGSPLSPLPFPGATYVTGQVNSHSRSYDQLRLQVLNRNLIRRPLATLSKLRRFRPVGRKFRREFMGLDA